MLLQQAEPAIRAATSTIPAHYSLNISIRSGAANPAARAAPFPAAALHPHHYY